MAGRAAPDRADISAVLRPIADAAEQLASARIARDEAILAALAQPLERRPTHAQIADAAGLQRGGIAKLAKLRKEGALGDGA
ncbi:MAG: hypothetical protein QM679_10065 [Patulibacter sp.]